MDTPAQITCEQLPAAIAAETDPAKKAVLQADFDQRCGGDSTQGGGGGHVDPDKPKQN